MKELIKQLLKEGLNELGTKDKKAFGYGREHNIYSSIKNPNVLFKVGDQETVDKWIKVFKSNPNLFPKTYRTGKLNSGKVYVEIEKLNTRGAITDWTKMEQALKDINVLDDEDYIDSLDVVFRNIAFGYMSESDILEKLKSNPQMAALFKKWVNYMKTANEYIKKFGYDELDIRRSNFAYDSAGNIKAIDI